MKGGRERERERERLDNQAIADRQDSSSEGKEAINKGTRNE